MKHLILGAVAISASACSTIETVAPNTVDGFRRGGVLGAVQGASRAVAAECTVLDGAVVRVTIDGAAALSDRDGLVDLVRAERREICRTAAEIIAAEADAEAPVP